MSGWQITRSRELRQEIPERLYVSLNKRGEFVMNPAAWRWLGDVANVTLLYDEERGLIGIKYPVAIDRHFFRVKPYGRRKRQRIVRAARMIRQFGISVQETLVFKPVRKMVYNKENVLLLDLNSADVISRRRSPPETW